MFYIYRTDKVKDVYKTNTFLTLHSLFKIKKQPTMSEYL